MHETYKFSDEGFDFRRVFFDISKGFDRVRRESLMFKLLKKSISGKLQPAALKRFFKIKKTASGLKWPALLLERCKCKYSRTDFGSLLLSNLYL